MEGIIGVAIVIIVIQQVLGIMQIRYYERFMNRLVKKYAGYEGYELNTEMVKKWYKKTFYVVVTNQNNQIVELYRYQGLTVFARFKLIEELNGRVLNEDLVNSIDTSKKSAFEGLLASINKSQ